MPYRKDGTEFLDAREWVVYKAVCLLTENERSANNSQVASAAGLSRGRLQPGHRLAEGARLHQGRQPRQAERLQLASRRQARAAGTARRRHHGVGRERGHPARGDPGGGGGRHGAVRPLPGPGDPRLRRVRAAGPAGTERVSRMAKVMSATQAARVLIEAGLADYESAEGAAQGTVPLISVHRCMVQWRYREREAEAMLTEHVPPVFEH